jgi:hypothetical protein
MFKELMYNLQKPRYPEFNPRDFFSDRDCEKVGRKGTILLEKIAIAENSGDEPKAERLRDKLGHIEDRLLNMGYGGTAADLAMSDNNLPRRILLYLKMHKYYSAYRVAEMDIGDEELVLQICDSAIAHYQNKGFVAGPEYAKNREQTDYFRSVRKKEAKHQYAIQRNRFMAVISELIKKEGKPSSAFGYRFSDVLSTLNDKDINFSRGIVSSALQEIIFSKYNDQLPGKYIIQDLTKQEISRIVLDESDLTKILRYVKRNERELMHLKDRLRMDLIS